MTHAEFYKALLTNYFQEDDKEMAEFAVHELAKIDDKNAKAKAKRIETAKANESLIAGITNYLQEHSSALGSELGSVLGVSTQKAIALANKMVENGTLAKVEVKIAKVGKRMSYSLVVEDEEEISNEDE